MTTIKEEKERILEMMEDTNPSDEVYKHLVQRYIDLELAEQNEFTIKNPNVLGAIASLSGVLLILNFERLGIIRSKALNFIPKIK